MGFVGGFAGGCVGVQKFGVSAKKSRRHVGSWPQDPQVSGLGFRVSGLGFRV